MNLPDHLVAPGWEWLGHGLLLLVAAKVFVAAPWRVLKDSSLQNAWLGSVVLVMLLWSIKAGITPGLGFHLLGATALTLMFGPELAIAGLTLVLFGITLAGMSGWGSFSLNAVVMVILPVLVSSNIHALADSKLPNHFFIYIFVSALLGAGVAMAASGVATAGLLELAGIYPASYLYREYLPFLVFMSWAEALLTGMVMTMMVIYRPDWVVTFDDARYLENK